ncbi:MAG TPA: CBS domain-containing protein [Casimicrobiaceae bacterium]|nr:CBS domain-containing protein [Casimicrobiaceae bacterium]
MKAKDVMTHCVVSIGPEAPILDAIARMISHQVSGMPVIDADGKLAGMVTEGDFLRRTEIGTEAPQRRWLELLLGPASRAEEYARSHGRKVQEVMSRNVVAASKETPLTELVELMEEHGIKRIPVTEEGRIVGIVSRADLMSALAERLSQATKAPASDESIRRAIMTEMKKQPWCPVQSLSIRVRNGFVDVNGTIFDEGQRRALHVLVENVHGVKGVHDHLTRIAPVGAA